jgi:hypothetical protein
MHSFDQRRNRVLTAAAPLFATGTVAVAAAPT